MSGEKDNKSGMNAGGDGLKVYRYRVHHLTPAQRKEFHAMAEKLGAKSEEDIGNEVREETRLLNPKADTLGDVSNKVREETRALNPETYEEVRKRKLSE